jgi:hypothetical protein
MGLNNERKVQGGQHYFWRIHYVSCVRNWRIHYVSCVRNRIVDEALHVQREKRKMRKRRR